ncbi:DUF6404 family protein [Vibrio sp. 99-70-13A1]|uniref:DUF6404 family protein n=1 Tax=Vibrio sp. 99-70-13A1 TaxID=2607601 RepID=UPI001493A5A8|nr:DUF6404 family protein [Vibrio sp. 99-70-13A1]NOH99388.1 hypothetical protein [Vibrio sp. 99-70-13A1]
MSFEKQLDAAHNELEEKGVWKSNFNPPIIKLLRLLGFKFPPPYYQKFLINLFFTSMFFGVGFGVISWLMTGQFLDKTVVQTLIEAGIGGLVFGFLMSTFYYVRRKQLGLTVWE